MQQNNNVTLRHRIHSFAQSWLQRPLVFHNHSTLAVDLYQITQTTSSQVTESMPYLFSSILSFPQLGVDTVCDNQDVTLMCHTDQTTGNMITWYWSNQSQHSSC